MTAILDSFIEAVIMSWDSVDKRLNKEQRDEINNLTIIREKEMKETFLLTSEQYEHILHLIEEFRTDESVYERLLDYFETITKATI
jgi:hypothetical protein